MTLMASAVVTFAIPASAQAAAHSVTPAKLNCAQEVFVNKGDGYEASISSSGVLDFVAASQVYGFCLASIPGSSTWNVIYTPNSSDCLAWSATAQDVYQHDPTGCGSNTNYLEWSVEG